MPLRSCAKQWVVLVSPPDAEYDPRYLETRFDQKRGAYSFAARERRRPGDRQRRVTAIGR
jgi:hypothetical protein